MLNAVNPYTKMRLADDPTIAVVLFYNEQNLRWSMSDFMGRMMQPKWIAFLKKKYGSLDAVRKAWKETPVPADGGLGVAAAPQHARHTEIDRVRLRYGRVHRRSRT